MGTMKTDIRRLLLMMVVAMGLAVTGCEDCSDTDPPITSPIRFAIVDAAGNNLVDTINSRYVPDSIKLFDVHLKTDIVMAREYNSIVKGYVFTADCKKGDSGASALILRLDQHDSDTIQVWYQRHQSRCFTTYNYTDFYHNGKKLSQTPQTAVLLIVKDD